MSERLGEALLDLRTNDKGFNAGIKRAEGGAEKLGGKLDQTSDKADNLSDRMRATGAALRGAGEASSAAAGAAMREASALYRMDAAAMAASKASVALAQAEYRKASAALASARADGEATKEAVTAAAAIKQKTFASLEAAKADYAQVIAAQRIAQADHAAATAAQVAARADDAAALASQRAADGGRQVVPVLDAHAKAAKNAALQQKLLVFQLNDVAVSLASGMPLYLVAIQQGSQMAQIWGPGEGGLGRALRETGKMAVNAATRFPLVTAAVALGAAAIAGMTYEVNQAQDVTVGFGDVTLATWQTIADGLSDLLKPAIDALGPWFKSAWDVIVSGVKTTGNEIINSFHAAGVDVALVAETIATHFGHSFERVKIIWSTLPAVLGDFVYSTANRVVDGIEAMINGAVDRINKLNDYLPEWAQFDTVDKVDLPGIENTHKGAAGDTAKALAANAAKEVAEIAKIWGDRNARITEIMASDPLGDFFSAVKDRSVENAIEREKEKKSKSGGDASGRTDAEKYQDLVRSAEQFIQAQSRERQSIGLTAEAAARLRYEQELLNDAANDNIKLTPQQTAELKRLAGEMAAAEAETTKLQESFDFAREVAGGFVSDVRQGLNDGKGLFKSFADAAVGALNRVIDKIMNEALDALFQLGSAGSGGKSGGGGFLGGIGNFFSSLFSGFFAKGGLIPSGTFGIVGEKGPEPVIGTSRGAMVLPNSSLKGMQSEAGGAMDIGVVVELRGGNDFDAWVTNVSRREGSAAAQDTVNAYDRGLPDRVQQINANPRRR
ncbi:phage tail length tape measure family protein [Sinorhizobium medicae WSM1115]|uniref:phage tail length tape measure family protein n=1 Tax=Sinorhizobium medicae TaxID=110321 RepID=UPI000361C8ED|nr:phage tail length tape measure family protein [Sinorhizobium medicae]UFX01160.1 phage tail length tape measure family protein [Sinorhizobium medicae WSM1115]